MSKQIVSLVPRNLMFKYRIACRPFDKKWKKNLELPESHKLPCFGEFEQQQRFADVRTGWNSGGLFLSVRVEGKKQSVWCRSTQLLESDGIQVHIDTRNTGNVHRATKFCHWFLLLPAGGGSSHDQPVATMLKINRAKDDPPSFNPGAISVSAKTSKDGYLLSAFIPAESMNGWNTEDHRMIGFNLAVVDREFGWQTLGAGPELPIKEDPALWQTLELRD
ncbi:MAG: hypothetical protein AAF456_06950 [Planctomycetota bacterium]